MIAVFDDFIQDKQLLEDIANDSSFFSDPGIYKYWNGWWNGEPKNLQQKLIQYIWRDNMPLLLQEQVHGFEYWTGIQSAEDPNYYNHLELHYDDDVNYRKQTGERMFPIMGCVYYPPGLTFTGGDLHVYTEGEENSPEIIKTLPNRLVIFNPGHVVHGVSEVTSGTRKAIAINMWGDEPWSVQNGFIIQE